MSSLTNEQVAELLIGIARSQLAIVDAIESSKAGFKSTHLRGTVESAARIKMNRPVALTDLPSRLLLQMLGRNAPTQDAVARELQALLSASPPAAADSDALDMTK